jgi:hypothetical protein
VGHEPNPTTEIATYFSDTSGGAFVLSSCPICGSPLKPALTDKVVFSITGELPQLAKEGRAYTCGSTAHVFIQVAESSELAQPANGQPASSSAARTRILNSWKEIAAHLGRGVRTVQRWERDLGLPVHRPHKKNRSAVVAFPEELNTWLHKTPMRTAEVPTQDVSCGLHLISEGSEKGSAPSGKRPLFTSSAVAG